MKIVFSDSKYWQQFLPLTFTRPVAELRCGILTFAERWKKILAADEILFLTEDYLHEKYKKPETGAALFIVPNFLPGAKTVEQIKNLKPGEALTFDNQLVAAVVNMENFSLDQITKMEDTAEPVVFFEKSTDLFSRNEEAINYDFELLTAGRQSEPLSATNGFLGNPEDLFIEQGASVEFSTLNCKTGKIYIGKDAEVMEGCHLRGPIALCEGSKFNLGAKIYGATSIGPHSKVGGEVSNIVIFGYSNKGHDGFVGNSVIGEWCNLGADTNSSNLKNNYSTVKLYNYAAQKMEDTGLQFCGVIMGDHSKTAINTQLNTGTTVGVASNIFRSGFPPTYIGNFSWGGAEHDEKFFIGKALEVAERVMARRKINCSEADKSILTYIFDKY